MQWEWAVWRMHGQPWQVSYARRARSAHDGGECALDAGPAEDREPAEEDGAEMVARWTKERSPGGGPGAEDSGTAGR